MNANAVWLESAASRLLVRSPLLPGCRFTCDPLLEVAAALLSWVAYRLGRVDARPACVNALDSLGLWYGVGGRRAALLSWGAQ